MELSINLSQFSALQVKLVPLCLEHAEALAQAVGTNRDSYQWTYVPEEPTVVASKEYIKKALTQKEEGLRFPFSIFYEDEIVGTTSYCHFENWDWRDPEYRKNREGLPEVLEIGYTWLSPKVQRTSCNTETKYLLLKNAFETWESLRVCFKTDERNIKSRNAIERLGAKREGIRRYEILGFDGEPRNSVFYSIIKEEWPEVKKKLESKLKTYQS